jgi:hypothetical protein
MRAPVAALVSYGFRVTRKAEAKSNAPENIAAYQTKEPPEETRKRVMGEWRKYLSRATEEFGKPE